MADNSIKFVGGVTRLANQSPSRPYDLHNCRVEPLGIVQATTFPTSAPPNDFPLNLKPFAELGDDDGREWVDHSLRDWGGNEDEQFYFKDWTRLEDKYVFTTNGGDGCGNTKVLEYCRDSVVPLEGVPKILSVEVIDTEETSGTTTEADADEGVFYGFYCSIAFVPYNRNGDRGPIKYTYSNSTTTLNKETLNQFQICVNESTDHVDVYKTVEMSKDDGKPSTEVLGYPYFFVESIGSNAKAGAVTARVTADLSPSYATSPTTIGTIPCRDNGSPSYAGPYVSSTINVSNWHGGWDADYALATVSSFKVRLNGTDVTTAALGAVTISSIAQGQITWSGNIVDEALLFYFAGCVEPGSGEPEPDYCVEEIPQECWQAATIEIDFADCGAPTTCFTYIDRARHSTVNVDNAFPHLPATPQLDDKIHAFASRSLNGDFGAQAIHNDNGAIIYGNISVPLKDPQIVAKLKLTPNDTWADDAACDPSNQLTYKRVVLQEVYRDCGEVHGPQLLVEDVQRLTVQWRGADALKVYVEGDDNSGVYLLYEEISGKSAASNGGIYVSAYSQVLGTRFSFDLGQEVMDAVDKTSHVNKGNYTCCNLKTEEPQQVAYCYNNPSSALVSEYNRPLGVFLDNQFGVYEGDEIRAIIPSRLAEDESLRAYTFYILTNSNVTAWSRNAADALDVVFDSTVAPHVGVTLSPALPNGYPVYSITRRGVAFLGTDKRIYFLTGRRYIRLDGEIIAEREAFDDLWAKVTDMTYHVKNDEIWVLTDTGAWVFSFGEDSGKESPGWIAHHSLSDLSYGSLTWDRKNSDILAIPVGGASTVLMEDTGCPRLDAYVQTNAIWDNAVATQIHGLRVQYDPVPENCQQESNHTNRYATVRHETSQSAWFYPDNCRTQGPYPIHPNRVYYPRLRGRAHRIKVEGFGQLGEIYYNTRAVPGNY